ncbi:uncharacterized protein CLUP02_15042, partial [Colletotrichum lupini]
QALLSHYRWLCLFLLLQVASCVGLQLHDTTNPVHSPTPMLVRSQTLQLSSSTPGAAHHMLMFTPHAPCSLYARSVGRSVNLANLMQDAATYLCLYPYQEETAPQHSTAQHRVSVHYPYAVQTQQRRGQQERDRARDGARRKRHTT